MIMTIAYNLFHSKSSLHSAEALAQAVDTYDSPPAPERRHAPSRRGDYRDFAIGATFSTPTAAMGVRSSAGQ